MFPPNDSVPRHVVAVPMPIIPGSRLVCGDGIPIPPLRFYSGLLTQALCPSEKRSAFGGVRSSWTFAYPVQQISSAEKKSGP